MPEIIPSLGAVGKLYLFVGAVVGAGVSLVTLRHFAPDHAAFISAMAIAVLVFLSTQVGRPILWWAGTGAVAGIVIGLALVMKETMVDTAVPLEGRDRLVILLVQGLAGFVSGAILGRKLHRTNVPPLRAFLTRISTLTAGVFAVVVTLSFLGEGLEAARALASRLSTTTTVLVTALTLPGLVGYLLFELDQPPPWHHRQR